MSIDYWGLVTKSLRTAWEYKFLWLFGFFVVVANGSGGMASDVSNLRHYRAGESLFSEIDPAYFAPGVIAIVVLALLFIALLFWIMRVLSEGALIHGILRKESGEKFNLGDCWSRGVDKFWSVFGIIVLSTIAAVVAFIGIVIFLIPAFIASLALGIVLAVFAIPVILAIMFVVEALVAWSLRLIVIDNVQWLDSIGDSWRMIRDNFGKTFGIAFSSVLTQVVLGIIFLLALAVIAIPFVLVGLQSPLLGIIPGAVAAIILIAVISGFEGVFKSSIWTFAYLQLTERVVPVGDTPPNGESPSPEPSDGAGI